jgi:hypothetical protein
LCHFKRGKLRAEWQVRERYITIQGSVHYYIYSPIPPLEHQLRYTAMDHLDSSRMRCLGIAVHTQPRIWIHLISRQHWKLIISIDIPSTEAHCHQQCTEYICREKQLFIESCASICWWILSMHGPRNIIQKCKIQCFSGTNQKTCLCNQWPLFG